MVHFLVAVSLEGAVLRAMGWYAGRADAEEAVLLGFLADLQRDRTAVRRAADRALAAELTCWGIADIEAFGRAENPFRCGAKGAECGTAFLRALAGHPRPFDLHTTVRELSDELVPLLASASSRPPPPRPQSGELARLYEAFRKNDTRSDDDLQADHAFLMSLSNPLGTLLREQLRTRYERLHALFRRGEAERELAAAVIGARLFEIRHGRLPLELAELVRAGLLAQLPNDPYRGTPLRYSPAARAVWSAGEDGTDDGGMSRTCGGEKTPRDIVRPIPEPLGLRTVVAPFEPFSGGPCAGR